MLNTAYALKLPLLNWCYVAQNMHQPKVNQELTLRYSLLNQLFAASGCPLISACCPAESPLAPVMVGRAPVTTRLPVLGTARVLRVAGSLLVGMEAKLGCKGHTTVKQVLLSKVSN